VALFGVLICAIKSETGCADFVCNLIHKLHSLQDLPLKTRGFHNLRAVLAIEVFIYSSMVLADWGMARNRSDM
jgi:hypothetical protein